MNNGVHVIIYSTDAEADRLFIRDVLGFAGVDAGGGWLIYKLPSAEIAVHPTAWPGKHEFFLMCDDIEKTLASGPLATNMRILSSIPCLSDLEMRFRVMDQYPN
jgi:hypothetical protein